MAKTLEPIALAGLPAGGGPSLAGLPLPEGGMPARGRAEPPPPSPPPSPSCHHCGEPCDRGAYEADGHAFCCLGCQTVFALLRDSGLGGFYDLADRPGSRVSEGGRADRWAFLDDPAVTAKVVDFNDGKTARVTFRVPAIHCVACVWLLENLYRLHPGIGRTRVDFARREVAVAYAPDQVSLAGVAGLLARLGYEPALTLAELDRPAPRPSRRLPLQIGVAGFAFGNIMLLSLPLYLGLDSWSGPTFRAVFGWTSLVLALPVVVFSAADYWRSAWASLRHRAITLDVPIAAGLAALYARSAWEIVAGRGEGYLDSLAGLVFLLLCGRVFQQRTHARLAFDRDYRGFFPLGVVRRSAGGEETVSISRLEVGDRLVVRHGELVPADARVVAGSALVDYSFVTGESEPVPRQVGDTVHAGGRQAGGEIEVETLRPVSASYLTSLWDDAAFRKERDDTFQTLTNRYSRRFTILVLAIAVLAAAGWAGTGDVGRAIQAFTAVLIIACPCALALAAPFTLGTAQRLLSRRGVCLRNSQVVEAIARVDAVALDKTGTLTAAAAARVSFEGPPLEGDEAGWIAAAFRQSSHPHARRLAGLLGGAAAGDVTAFREEPGRGIAATVAGHAILAGSAAWLAAAGIETGPGPLPPGGTVFVALDGRFRGVFLLGSDLRPEVDALLRRLGERFELALLSGDNERERPRFAPMFGGDARVHFNLSPGDKLGLIRGMQEAGRTVMMVGDGLNDAGALRQGDVGVAVVEGVGKFSPASDVILDAAMVPHLERVVDFCRRATRVVKVGFGISAVYNAAGIAIAAAGVLSPLVCAVLMPASSISVVLFAVGATTLAARRTGLLADAAAARDRDRGRDRDRDRGPLA